MNRDEFERRSAEMRARFDATRQRSREGVRSMALGEIKALTVKEVAARVRFSRTWVYRHFENVDGVIKIPGSMKAGARVRLRIPEQVLEQELLRLTAKKMRGKSTEKVILRAQENTEQRALPKVRFRFKTP